MLQMNTNDKIIGGHISHDKPTIIYENPNIKLKLEYYNKEDRKTYFIDYTTTKLTFDKDVYRHH